MCQLIRTVHLESTDGSDDHGAVGSQAAVAALDVVELFAANVGTETGLGHDETVLAGELHAQRRLVGMIRRKRLNDHRSQ